MQIFSKSQFFYNTYVFYIPTATITSNQQIKKGKMVFCYQNCSDLQYTVRKDCQSDQEKIGNWQNENQKTENKKRQ